MNKRYEIIDKIIEIEIYLYIIFMFLTKGEGIRNILLFSTFFLWLLTLKQRENLYLLREPVSKLFWIFLGGTLFSVIFSIEPLYSLVALQSDLLKAALIFPVISTTLSNKKRLKRFVYLSFFILVFTISVGYYSYWAYDLPIMKPYTSLRHAWHTRFAIDLNTLLPFSFIIFLTTKNIKLKGILLITIIAGISALILSTSRAGIAAFLCMVIVWSIYSSKNNRVNLKPILVSLIIVVLFLGIVSFYFSPKFKNRFIDTRQDITTLNGRTRIWLPLLYAVSERLVSGWGYGDNIFKMNRPFEKTPFKVAPAKVNINFRQPHSTFLKILFHQGIIGLILYLALLVTAIRAFGRGAYNEDNLNSYIFIACVSILISTYLFHSIIDTLKLRDLTLVLGAGVAASNLRDEDSHN